MPEKYTVFHNIVKGYGDMDMTIEKDIEFLTQKDVGNLLGLSSTTVWKLFHAEDFPFIKIGGKYLVEKNALVSFLNQKQAIKL